MSYTETIETINCRDQEGSQVKKRRGRQTLKTTQSITTQVLSKRSRSQELEEEANKIRTGDMADFCSVLRFN